MKCPHCGIEVEPGTIFCPECLTEIPWVPEYNTVETLLTQKRTKKEAEDRKKEKLTRDKRRKNRVLAGVLSLVIGFALILGVKFALDYRNHNSYDYQYRKAESAYSNQKYDQALEYITRAMELDADNLTGNILYAHILEETGEAEAGVALLEELVYSHPADLELYGALIHILLRAEKPERVQELLSDCGQEEVLERYADYLAVDPSASVETGVYDEEKEIILSAGECTIYYTLDGSTPTQDSQKYTSPIPVKEGVTELNAISVSKKGIPSDVVYWKYTVVIKGPDAPVVTPKAGSYEEPMMITMEIPDGCKGYYAFDGQVSTASKEYTGPVEMPQGSHTFNAILVAAGGKESETVSLEYTYTPADGEADKAEEVPADEMGGDLSGEGSSEHSGEGSSAVVVGTPEKGNGESH